MSFTPFGGPENELMAALAREEDGTGDLADMPVGDQPKEPLPAEQIEQPTPHVNPRVNGSKPPPVFTPPEPARSSKHTVNAALSDRDFIVGLQKDQIEMSHQLAHVANDAAATRKALFVMCAGLGCVALLLMLAAYKMRAYDAD